MPLFTHLCRITYFGGDVIVIYRGKITISDKENVFSPFHNHNPPKIPYLCIKKNNIRFMETIAKRQTAFRFNSDLLDRLKVAAKREHKSLNKYVECLLMDLMYNEPNEKTKAAIEEARTAKEKETFDSVEGLMKELMK